MSMVEINGVNIHYTVKGEGVPIVFIHPPLLTSANFYYQMKELSTQFQIITFDIRGHGSSDYSDKPINYRLIADDIKELLDHLQIEKAFICGYSTGGSIVLEYLLTYPYRALGGIVVSGMSDATKLTLNKKIALGKNLAKAGAKKFISWAVSWGNANNKEMYRLMYEDAIKGDIRNIEQYYHYSMQYNCSHLLDQIESPILLVYGGKDKQFHYYANLLHEKLPDNELKMIPGAKHQIPTKNAVEFNEMIKQFVINHI